MKKIILFIVTVFVLLVLVLLVRTWTYPFVELPKTEAEAQKSYLPSEKAIKRFAGGLQIPTISTVVYEETDFAPFKAFKSYLPEVYPEIYKTMETQIINEYGLVFHWKGKDPAKKPVLFLSHYDVVPVIGYDPSASDDSILESVFKLDDQSQEAIQEISEEWMYSPFSGAVADGRIYGRGALDMKNMLFSLLEAADTLIADGFQPEQDIWFAFGHDEEVGGLQGAFKIAEYFKEQGIEFAAVYDEGGVVAAPKSALPTINRPVALVGLGEKGFLTLKINVYGIGGHSSMPPAKSSLVYAAEIIKKLNENQMPGQVITPIASFLNTIGGEMDFMSQMAIANQWLLGPTLLKSLAKAPASNALTRTTTAITMAKGSDASNVITSVAEVVVNFRILPGDSIDQVIKHVEGICEGYDVKIETVGSSREASGITPEGTKGFDNISEIVAEIYPEAITSSYITVGGTDAYKYQIVSDNIYRFMPVVLNQYEQRLMHNENEHISIENYGKMIYYFKELMKKEF